MNMQQLINLRVLSICSALLFAHASLWAYWQGNILIARIMLFVFSLLIVLAISSLFIRQRKP